MLELRHKLLNIMDLAKAETILSEQFHTPTDWPVWWWKTEDRISWFRLPQAVVAKKTAEAALQSLIQQEFKIIFFGRDLCWMLAG